MQYKKPLTSRGFLYCVCVLSPEPFALSDTIYELLNVTEYMITWVKEVSWVGFLLALLFAGVVLLPQDVFAQGAGVSISPATIEESLDPGDSEEFSVTVQNLSSEEQTYYLYTRNISGVRDGGVPIFASSDLEQTGYELADWITLETNQIVVAAGAKQSLNFQLNVPQDASCSHFGGIFISVDPPELQNSGAAVGYQVANIISLRISGDCNEEASIRQFSTTKFLYGSQNVDFVARIENTGDVLVRPTGPLEIYNMLGNKVGSFTFNEERSAVFPNSERTFDDINWTGNSLGFGRYEAILTPVYGEEGAIYTMSNTVTFWILPMNIIGPALGVLAVVLIIAFIMIKLYIRRSLAHLNQGRRVINRRKKSNSSTLVLLAVVTLTVTALFLIVLLALFA